VPESLYHPRMARSEAEEFIDSCELGQTEEGSYTVTIRCPMGSEPGGALVSDVPFARQATEKLFQSVSTLVSAIDTNHVIDVIQPGLAGGTRVTANLCDALVKMQPDAENASLALSVNWARTLPQPSIASNSVVIRSEQFPAIAQIGKDLR